MPTNQAVQALHRDMEGIAARAHDSSRLVGAGLVRFGKCQFEGAVYPFAMLGNRIIHPDYRGQGLAAQLVQRQDEKARERCGNEMVIVTNFQAGNRISHKIYNWIWANRATTIAVLLDPLGPLRKVFSTYARTVKAKTHMLFHAPKELRPGKPVCPIF